MENVVVFGIVSLFIIHIKGNPVDIKEIPEEALLYDPLIKAAVVDSKSVNEGKNEAAGKDPYQVNNGSENSDEVSSGVDDVGCEDSKYKDVFGELPAENAHSKREKRYEANVVQSCQAPAAPDEPNVYQVLEDTSGLAVRRVKQSWYY